MNMKTLVCLLVLYVSCCHGGKEESETYVRSSNALKQQKRPDFLKWVEHNFNAILDSKTRKERLPQAVDARMDDALNSPYSQSAAVEILRHKSPKKRDTSKDDRYVYKRLNSPTSPLEIYYAEPASERRKRAMQNFTVRWNYNVPYIIHSSFSNQGSVYVDILKRAIRYIMDRVCLTFVDETARYNPSVSNWFTTNGYSTNGYIIVYASTGCSADSGPGNGNSARIGYPCTEYDVDVTPSVEQRSLEIFADYTLIEHSINAHEWLHLLGGAHVQQGPNRTKYVTINRDDILPSYQYAYNVFPVSTSSYNMLNEYLDSASLLMYGPSTWTRNSLDAYTPIRDDLFTPYRSPSTDDVMFSELNRVYQCNAQFCGNSSINCGPGYYAKVKGVCRCVCPSEYDVDTNCQTLKNGPTTYVSWPNTPIVLWAGGPSHTCPTGFDPTPGWFSFTGNSTLTQSPAAPVQFPFSTKTHFTPLCTKSTPTNGSLNWESWPAGGQYCFVKPLGVSCGGAFIQSGIVYKSVLPITMNGSLGETYYDSTSQNITQYYCCRFQEASAYPIDLPDAEPFRLLTRGGCPNIRGLKAYNTRINAWTAVSSDIVAGVSPWWFFSTAITTYSCYYQPPVYGCNQLVTLNSTVRSVTITTPGFPTARTPNRRCFYGFNVPPKSQIRITLNTCDLSATNDDLLLIKRLHQFQEPVKVDVTSCPSQILSVDDYLSLEYWSAFDTVTKKGLNFTAEVILPEDQCYDVSTKGAEYIGDTSITETYEPCLPWAQTLDCNEFPTSEVFWLLQSGNKCRNPQGSLDQPWCYTYKNGTNCNIRYCDVCNLRAPVDTLKSCATKISADPSFCSTSYQKLGCFKSCGFSQVAPPTGSCGPPTIPSDGLLVGTLKSSYRIGERVKIQCTAFVTSDFNEIMCTPSGWTNLTKACQDCPSGYITYGDRCFRWIGLLRDITTASTYCSATYGTSGALFQIRDSVDQQTIRDYKALMGSGYYPATWVSGRLQNTNGPWWFTNTNTVMTYFNWSSAYVPNDMNNDCIAMQAETDPTNAGGWATYNCEGTTTNRFFCQLNRNGVCVDKTDRCEAIMAAYPSFCSGSQTVSYSDLYCSKSCGDCQSLPNCTEPTSSVYYRTSALASVYPGSVMTFECNAGYYYVSGDKARACSSSGNLLGTELVCQAQPVDADINLNSVIQRRGMLTTKLVIVLDKTELSIPFNGKISVWYYYCKTPGLVSFLVYRKSGTTYTYVGANNVTCEANFKMSFPVPAASQIAVQANDLIGVYTAVNSVAAADCTSKDLICNFPSVTANTWAEVQTKAINAFSCRCVSFGARVTPV